MQANPGNGLPTAAPAPIRPFRPVSRLHEVEARIREYLEANQLGPGDRLPGEAWFAEQLGVGRPLIREALRGLEAVGVIETRTGVGRFVRAFEVDAYVRHIAAAALIQSFSERELIETRCLLEVASACDAVERLTEDDLIEIERLWSRMQARAVTGEADTAADLGLHQVIMSRSDNRLIAAMLDAVYALAVKRVDGDGYAPEKLREDLREHERIVAAALRRDGRATRDALIAHFDTTAERLGFAPRWRELFAWEDRHAVP